MKREQILVAIILLVPISCCGCGGHKPEKANGIIKIGMELKEAVKLLTDCGASEAFLAITYPKVEPPTTDATGSKEGHKCYALPNKPYVVIDYVEKNGKDVIKALSLYYEYGHKGRSDNKWLNVKEIDLKNISLKSDQDKP